MSRVALLVTGKLEHTAFARAFSKLFPSHHFEVLPTEREIAAMGRLPTNGFTTCALNAQSVINPPGTLLDLIGRAAGAALGDRRSDTQAYDLVVIIDDLELCNQHQPQLAVEVVRAAVTKHLDTLQRSRRRTERALKDPVSLHFAVPMVESWIFADAGGALRAGVPAGNAPLLRGRDCEQFHVIDEEYLTDDGSACLTWHALAGKKRDLNKPIWLKGLNDRANHPKRYLAWLCKEPLERNCTSYSETANGAEAVADLDWAMALAQADGMRFLRSLVLDMVDILGAPAVDVGVVAQPLTSRNHLPRDPVLRNL